jgi:hypothetical protein
VVAQTAKQQASAAALVQTKHSGDLATIKRNNSSNFSGLSAARKVDVTPSTSVLPKYKTRKPNKEVVSSAWVEVRLAMPRSIGSDQFADLTQNEADVKSTSSSSSSSIPAPSMSSERWVHVDVVQKLFDQPQAVEMSVRKGLPVHYVVAIETSLESGRQFAVDVTARYQHLHRHTTAREKDTRTLLTGWFQSTVMAMTHKDKRFHSYDSKGGDDEWQWQSISNLPVFDHTSSSSSCQTHEGVIDLCGDDEIILTSQVVSSFDLSVEYDEVLNPLDGQQSSSSRKKRKASSALDSEEQELSALHKVAHTAIPTRFADFKDHPLYLLERHLLLDEALHPAARTATLVGVFRGEIVHLRKFHEKLKTRVQWRRELRSVIPGEEPIRISTRKKMTVVGGDGEGTSFSNSSSSGDNTVQIRMFGSWQTQPMEVGGVVATSYFVVHDIFLSRRFLKLKVELFP